MKISQITKLIPQKLGKKPSLEKVVKVHGFGPYGMLIEEGEPKMAQLQEYCHELVSKIKESTKKEKISDEDVVYHIDVYHPNVGKLDGLRILHISDTHFSESEKQREKFELYSFLNHEEFDLVMHTGDITNSGKDNFSDFQLSFLKDINSRLGKYFIFGGHDYWNNGQTAKLKETIARTGFVEVGNSSIHLENEEETFNLMGLDEFQDNFKGANQAEPSDKNQFNMLMIHNLDKLTSEFSPSFDLILSGHLHAGEFNFGIINGYDYLSVVDDYLNLNRQRIGFKFLTDRTLSYISPGFHTHIQEKWGLPRMNAEKQGVSILTLRQYNL